MIQGVLWGFSTFWDFWPTLIVQPSSEPSLTSAGATVSSLTKPHTKVADYHVTLQAVCPVQVTPEPRSGPGSNINKYG